MVSSKLRGQRKKREQGKTDRDLARPGKNFDHRKGWVQDRLRDLAGICAIDLTGLAVMSNHFHVVLRIRPDLTQGWTDEVRLSLAFVLRACIHGVGAMEQEH